MTEPSTMEHHMELHGKIRELEAELAERREEYFVVVRERQDAMTRAEKAEAHVAAISSCPDCGDVTGEIPERRCPKCKTREREAE